MIKAITEIKYICLMAIMLLPSLRGYAEWGNEPHDSIFVCDEILTEDSVSMTDMPISSPEPHAINKARFNAKELILPGALVVVGSFGVWNKSFKKLNNSIRDGMADLRGNHYFKADDYIQYLPVAAYLGLGAVGVKSKHVFKERFVAGATAYLALGILVNATKYSVREKRPDSTARNSFPSGHTATVFMGAELIRQEYGLGLSIGAYAVATGVAFLRLYNDRHWFNDVIAGAGIGILSARIGYWMLPLYQKWFHWDRDKSVAILPNYNYNDRSIGIGLAATF